MIVPLPPVRIRPLPEGQDWIVAPVNGVKTILIDEALDEDGRKAALKAAVASLKRDSNLAWLPLPAIFGLDWLYRATRHPVGAATLASLATVAAFNVFTGDPPRSANPPPPVVTVTPSPPPATSPTAASTTSATSAPPRWERSTRRPDPATTVRAVRPTRTRPPRTPAPRTRTARPTPRASTAEREPTITAVNGPATPPPGPADTAPPGPETTPAPAPDDPGPAPEGPEIVDEKAASGPVCDGLVHVDVGLDPLLGVDACLLG